MRTTLQSSTLRSWLGYAAICYVMLLPVELLADKWSEAPPVILWSIWILSPLLCALAAVSGIVLLLAFLFASYSLRSAWNTYRFRHARSRKCPAGSCCGMR